MRALLLAGAGGRLTEDGGSMHADAVVFAVVFAVRLAPPACRLIQVKPAGSQQAIISPVNIAEPGTGGSHA